MVFMNAAAGSKCQCWFPQLFVQGGDPGDEENKQVFGRENRFVQNVQKRENERKLGIFE